jgi:hypothetical protein
LQREALFVRKTRLRAGENGSRPRGMPVAEGRGIRP